MAKAKENLSLATRVIAWQRQHGRHNLSWQHNPTPYRVWLSETMLQQTQVATVIPYFEKFTEAFVDVNALAAAPLDRVLQLWAGLGYYSRARNLHKTAVRVSMEFGGEFPNTVEQLETLPGVGRSTAGAIVSLAFNQRAAILDGNVKRVLARFHAIAGWPGKSAVMKTLWQHAEAHLPKEHHRSYAQAMMDLGATLCTAKAPACAACPLGTDCAAHALGTAETFPGRKPKKVLPVKRACFLVVESSHNQILLERRPEHGIWGGLWSFPQIETEHELDAGLARLGIKAATSLPAIAGFRHTFTHFHLEITPIRLRAENAELRVRDNHRLRWVAHDELAEYGVPKAVDRILKNVARA